MNKKWKVEFKPSAFKELAKLPTQLQSKVFHFLNKLVATHSSPRALGLPLRGKHKGLWRYRVGDYRLICEIQDSRITILVLGIGHRREVYAKQTAQLKSIN